MYQCHVFAASKETGNYRWVFISGVSQDSMDSQMETWLDRMCEADALGDHIWASFDLDKISFDEASEFFFRYAEEYGIHLNMVPFPRPVSVSYMA